MFTVAAKVRSLRFLAASLLVAIGPVAVPAASQAASAPRSFGSTVTITGRGSGHGDGLSQWGALGYAVTYGWDWTQIVDYYYGGTTRSTIEGNPVVRVDLTALDDAPSTTVVQETAQLSTTADGGAKKYASIVAIETSANTYRVYGRSDQMKCPTTPAPAALDVAASGWTLVNPAFVSVSTGARLVVSAPTIDVATPTVSSLPGVCAPDGSIRHYRGSIEITNGSAGENRTVNAVPVEQYLRGVVPRESIASWADLGGGKGANALRAQAVAARTYVLIENRNTYAQSCDTTNCQVYGGAARRLSTIDAVEAIEDPRSNQAIDDTAGVVMRKADGTLAYTQFGAASGGYTSGANFAAVEDLGDSYGGNSSHAWTASIPRATLEAAYPTIGQLLSIDVTERNGIGEWGGRARSVRVRGTTGSATVTGDAFRFALHLKSSWFSVANGCDDGPRLPSATSPAAGFHPMTPTRIVDTREGRGGSPLEKNCVLAVHVAGTNGVPSTATAVVVNVTAIGTSTAGYLSAYPCDQGQPAASAVNARAEAPVANLAAIPIDSRGDICVFTQPATGLIIDLLGWFGSSGSGFRSVGPTRLADSRDGLGTARGPVPAGSTTVVDLSANPAVPAGVTAVVFNLTATRSVLAGFLTVFPCGTTVPIASNVNTVAGRDVANEVLVALSADRKFCIYSEQPTDVVIDLLGVFGAGDLFRPNPPARALDTRNGAVLKAGEVRMVPVGTASGSVAVNLTSTRSSGPGYMTAFPCGSLAPTTSNLNIEAGRDTANQALLRIGDGGAICLTSTVTTDVIVDVQGTFSPATVAPSRADLR